MIVVIAATQLEMIPFLGSVGEEADDWRAVVTGVGPLETAVRLGRFLAEHRRQVSGVLQFGVGGAYVRSGSDEGAGMLDVCLATSEVMGDFGICLADGVDYFPPDLGGGVMYSLENPLSNRVEEILRAEGRDFRRGPFVTVNGVTATMARGIMLAGRWRGLCENMEGAAAARLADEYGVELVELRVVSNLVEDRDPAAWRLMEAAEMAGGIAAHLVKELI